jgi:phage replication-related protein YjqB (UPF0714/DUF867 family)
MGSYEASVRRALDPEQKDLLDHEEHCSADPERLAAAGAERGRQVRIQRGSIGSALYTVSELRPETLGTVVRMGKDGRERLGTSEEFEGVLDTRVTRSELADCEALKSGEFIERLQDNGSQGHLIVLAPHGGAIEPHTDEQAEHVATRLGARRASVWLCRGYRSGNLSPRRWHATSDDIDPRSFPALHYVFGRRFVDAVSFHGFTRDGRENEIVVGGAAKDRLKRHVAAVLTRSLAGTPLTVHIAPVGDPLGGTDSRNIVNRITATGRGGVQIEQGPVARDDYALIIADAIARVYRARLRRRSAYRALRRLLGRPMRRFGIQANRSPPSTPRAAGR